MSKHEHNQVVLGLDIGPNSIGWALVEKSDGAPDMLKVCGVRVFEAGLAELEMDGKGKSRNAERRDARGRRRLLERRGRRLAKVANRLMRIKLLPDFRYNDPIERHQAFKELDDKYGSPYSLRAKALNIALERHALGRAFYHLAQRRGFKSNRKSTPKESEKIGEVKKSIVELQAKIAAVAARSLGEYFAMIEPTKERIRQQYIGRDMIEAEFKMIWEQQAKFYPEMLTESNQKKIHKAIFHQRPLKVQSKFVGKCELEPKKKRAPWALIEAQKFRYLQKVNDLMIEDDSGGRKLTEEERNRLVEKLDMEGDQEFSKIRKLLGLSGRTTKFNLERGGEKKIPGNRTTSRLVPTFGFDRWKALDESQKNAAVEDWRATVKEEILAKHGVDIWGLDEENAKKFSNVSLESGYCSFSVKAIKKLLPHLETGMRLQETIKEEYSERWARKGEPQPSLPPVDKSGLSTLTNPIVHRSLSELRRVVNNIISEYGKPDVVKIELARDLKQNAKDRAETSFKMRENQKAREKAAAEIIKECGISEPSQRDILKYLLAEECEWTCPYTGRKITMSNLISSNPQFDIEHIIPFDRCLDDSYMNKTLCEVNENRIKGKRTPYEAYHGTTKWDEIIQRVKSFKGNARNAKLRRFLMNPQEVSRLLDDFTARQLNDTRWAARWAKQYLGLLYGGVESNGVDSTGKLRVQVTSGQTTAFLRNEWNLNSILGDGPGKSRDDHRHHLVDAVVVALTDQGVVKGLSEAASRAGVVGRRLFDRLRLPWEGFDEQVREAVKKTIVSHRVSHRVRGALHKETFYGRLRKDERGKNYVHVRVPIESMSMKDIEKVVDIRVRRAIEEKLLELSGQPPSKAFKDKSNHPVIKDRRGNLIPIHRVRIKEAMDEYLQLDDCRVVRSDRNHHVEIYEYVDKKGNTKWDSRVVSLIEAYNRVKSGQPAVNREIGEGKKFLFSLGLRDTIELLNEHNEKAYFTIHSLWTSKVIVFAPANDARKSKEATKGHMLVPESLRVRMCRKVIVTPTGQVRYASN